MSKNDSVIVYKCDPKKNKKCSKGSSCQTFCKYTFHEEYSVDGGKRYYFNNASKEFESLDG